MVNSRFSIQNRCPRAGLIASTAAVAAVIAAACGSSPPPEPVAPPAPSAAAPEASAAPAEAPKEEKHCFLGESEASEYAHELVLAVFSSPKFNSKRIMKASTPENLKVLEHSLRNKMFEVACNKPWAGEKDTVEGALLVLGLMDLDEAQWEAVAGLKDSPPSFRVLPAEAQEWLKEPGSLSALKPAAKAEAKVAQELVAAAAKELKCGKDAVSVRVKSRLEAEVDGCKRTVAMRYDGGWRKGE